MIVNVKDLAIMIMEIVDVDMEIVDGEGYAYGHNLLGKLSPKLYITEDDNDMSFLDLIEDIYGICIERSELGLAIFSIAHEIGHHMDISNKSKLARFINDIKNQGIKKKYNKSCEETEEIYRQYKKEYEAYLNKTLEIRNIMSECIENHDFDTMREVLEKQKDNVSEGYRLVEKLKSIMAMREQHRIDYRLMPGETYADKWAIEFIKAHFPELIVGRI